jgi:SLT domain-containing protein
MAKATRIAPQNTHLKPVTSRDITPAFLAAIAAKVTPEDIANAISELLGATAWVKDSVSTYKEVPDMRAKADGIKFWLSYQLGLPVQRTEIVTATVDTEEITMAKLMASPAARKAMMEMFASYAASEKSGK